LSPRRGVLRAPSAPSARDGRARPAVPPRLSVCADDRRADLSASSPPGVRRVSTWTCGDCNNLRSKNSKLARTLPQCPWPGAKYWHQVLGEIRNRGVNDVLFVVCDGLRAWSSPSPKSGRSRSCRRMCCTSSATPSATRASSTGTSSPATSDQAARERIDELADKWGERYPAVEDRVSRVRAVRRLPPRDPQGHLFDETRSSACTRGCGAAPVRAATSRPSRPRGSASTSPSPALTLRVEAINDRAPARSPALNAFAITFERLTNTVN
jgi:hypothetical protein